MAIIDDFKEIYKELDRITGGHVFPERKPCPYCCGTGLVQDPRADHPPFPCNMCPAGDKYRPIPKPSIGQRP